MAWAARGCAVRGWAVPVADGVVAAVGVADLLPVAVAALVAGAVAAGVVVTFSIVLATVVVPESIVASPSLVYPSIMQISTQVRVTPDP
jgi:hypothetical protein